MKASFPTLSLMTAARACFWIAFGFAGVLGYLSLTRQVMPGCGAGGGCESVLSSPWAWVGPVPVAWLGAFVYGLCAIVLCLPARRTWMRPLSLLLFGGCVAAALVFVGLQIFVLGQVCVWCCSIHGLALAGVALALGGREGRPATAEWAARPLRYLVGGGFATAVLLGAGLTSLTGQTGSGKGHIVESDPSGTPLVVVSRDEAGENGDTASEAAGAEEPAGKDEGTITLLDGRFTFRLADLPRLGPADARHHVVAITDPTCPHCREVELDLAAAPALYPEGELAIVFLPGTRDPLIGPAMQKILLALWRERPADWKSVHADLAAGRIDATVEALKARAVAAFGGQDKLDRALKAHQETRLALLAEVSALAAAHAESAGHEFVVPQILVGTASAFGRPGPERLHALLQDQFQLEAPSLERIAAAGGAGGAGGGATGRPIRASPELGPSAGA